MWLGHAYLQGKLEAVEAVLGAVGGGIASAPMEGDPPHLKCGSQTSATDKEFSIDFYGHCEKRAWLS